MNVAIPLGQLEGQRLEFKGRDALKKPQLLSRAVVAMLNADGGDVWVGLREASGRAVQVEPIVDARAKMGSLWNHLIDTIDPPPLSGDKGEIGVESVPASEGEEVLRIRVAPRERGPYAQLKEGGRFFFIRVGDRVRSMTREEIAQGFQAELSAASKAGSASNKALEFFREERERLLKLRKALFWIRLQPETDLSLELRSPQLKLLLVQPLASGNRPTGFNVMDRLHEPRCSNEALSTEGDRGSTRIYSSGALEFQCPLDRLWHTGPRDMLYPFRLMELTTSLLRLGAQVYSLCKPRAEARRVWADLGLFSVKGWRLHPSSPHGLGNFDDDDARAYPDDSLVLPRQLAIDMGEIVSEPDRCAYRLYKQVYEAFGYTEDQIPSEFDRKSGKLRIGDG